MSENVKRMKLDDHRILEGNSDSSHMEESHLNEYHGMNVAIIGGGISGFSTALALSMIGLRVSVYERDLHFSDRRQGFGMTLTNNHNGALDRLGIRQECQIRSCPSSCHYFFNQFGDVLGYFGRKFDSLSTENSTENNSNQHFNLRIPRQELREIILNRLLEKSELVTIFWGYKLISYDEKINSVELKFEVSSIEKSCSETSHVKLVSADLVVGCDGLRSVVRQLFESKRYIEKNLAIPSPLQYLGISVILGLSTYSHPLIDKRGFYVLDGQHRLFLMPFKLPGCTNEIDEYSNKGLTMWQLSFSGLTEEEGIRLKSSSPQSILNEALNRVSTWFEPVSNIISETPLKEVWSTPLYDRNPYINPYDSKNKFKSWCYEPSRVIMVGDAYHPMSMFKGQGANQAMEDGPLLAKWLGKESCSNHFNPKKLFTKLKCFEREMMTRTSIKVLESRKAANNFHRIDVFDGDFGLSKDIVGKLKISGVNGKDGNLLDSKVLNCMKQSSS